MRWPCPFRRVEIVVAGVAALFFLGIAGVSWAMVAGSKHDFTISNGTSLNKGGVCTPCHTPHYAPDAPGIWARGLSDERYYYDQSAPKNPDYLPSPTLLCYDCHDDMLTVPDKIPPDTTWDSSPAPQGHRPQDIALNGASIGYYELYCRFNPKPGTGNLPAADGDPTGGHYWKSNPSGTPEFDNPDYLQGDKIACSLCHDVHNVKTGTNDVFFRTSTWDGDSVEPLDVYGTDLRKSKNSRLPSSGGDNRETGREMCATCHGYSDAGAQKTFFNVTVPKPPVNAIVPEHVSVSVVACTDCHGHNQIAGCNECHGYPPLSTAAEGGGAFDRTHPTRKSVENYPGGAGAHRRHKDALEVAGSSIFTCELCHGPNPGRPGTAWHNEGCGTFAAANVDIMGLSSVWDPDNSRTTAYTGAGSTVTPIPSGYEFVAKGGGDQRCSGLACHGDPPNNAGDLNWTDDMVDGDTDTTVENPAPGELRICKWCHDATPAIIDFGSGSMVAPNVMGTGGDRSVSTNFGAEVNGHGLSASTRYDRNTVAEAKPVSPIDGPFGAGKECTVCHDAHYKVNPLPPPANIPNRTHFDNLPDSAEKRLQDTINGLALISLINPPQTNSVVDTTCVACHQNGATGSAAEGTEVSTHGNSAAGNYFPLEPDFVRSCRQCHDVHGANWNGAGRNLYMIGAWVDADNDGVPETGEEARVDSLVTPATPSVKNITSADNAVVFTSRTGANSFDEVDSQDADDICATCHVPATGGGVGTGGGDHSGTGAGFDMRGQDCTQCHDHDFDNVPATADGFMRFGCEDCHGKDGVVHNGRDGQECTDDDAPNVMTLHVGTSWVSVWDGTWWDTQQGGNNTTQQGGHGDPDGKENGNVLLTPICQDCHNASVPAGTHLNGTYNSLGTELPRGSITWTPQDCSPPTPRPKANLNTNTAHVLPAYFAEFPGGSGQSVWQVSMDNYCYQKCHVANTVNPMDHHHDPPSGPSVIGPVELGTFLTRTAPISYLGTAVVPLIDSDVTTIAAGLPNHAPCVSCHNPHGTMVTDTRLRGTGQAARGKNNMLIEDWYLNGPTSPLCLDCHE